MSDKLIKQKVCGPITLQLLETKDNDYIVLYSTEDKELERYEYKFLAGAEQDYNTLRCAFIDMLAAIESTKKI